MRAWWLLGWLVACGGQQAAECTYDSQCGELAICQGEPGVCVSVDCLESADCATGSYCSSAYRCDPGCGTDRDCDAGKLCNVNTHVCESTGCRSTELDCALGQYCDPSDGKCKQDDRGHCQDLCDAATEVSCSGQRACAVMSTGASCGNDNHCEDGWNCDTFAGGASVCHLDYCAIQCDPDAEQTCPRGMSCFQGVRYDKPNLAYCVGDCAYLTDNGFL